MTDSILTDQPDEAKYTVELPQFEGPLGLLLSLIEREELDITRISLARVTDQFLLHLEMLQQINPDELTDFLAVAAKLILIKSEVLLPRPPPSIIEEEEEDVGDELARQLLIYKQFKDVAMFLRELEEREQRSFIRLNLAPPKVEPKLEPGAITLAALLVAAKQAFAIKPPEPDVDEVIAPQPITIREQMNHIREVITTTDRLYFRTLLSEKTERIEVIVTLLAVLELIKRRIVRVEQDALFGEIILTRNRSATALTDDDWEDVMSADDYGM